ncbi:MAG: ABC transporter permease [Clostridia bacterium]|nr:ABC transporter permease [Clostridia bacterium]
MTMKQLRPKEALSAPLETAVEEQIRAEDLSFAPYNPEAGERGGYSNYSYWGSTFRCFLKKRTAVGFMLVLVILLLFTCIQPLLPQQFEANLIIDHPITKRQMSNISPALTNVVVNAAPGTELIVHPFDNEEWAAVDNILTSIKARKDFTVLEYGEDWCRIEYNGTEGYVRNDFTTKIKFPDDPTATPYQAKSNFALNLFTSPQDLSQNGEALFCKKSQLRVEGDKAVTLEETPLRLLPDTRPFLFGTNSAGQDLWAKVWSGTRTSLLIGVTVAVLQSLIGILIGVLWGYVKSLDKLLTEVYNIIDNIPTTIVLILVSYIMRPGVETLILAMTVTGWVGMARFIRNQIVIIRDRDYNLASRCLGNTTGRIITRNLLPYLVSVIMLRLALAVPGAIGSEVFITYIGLGLPLSVPSLGNLINEGRRMIATSQNYQLVFPTLVLSLITISFYIIGNSFADAADPKNHL